MKTIYIPKGETVCYDTLNTENLVVKGTLHVIGDLRAKHIGGKGIIMAGSISADDIRASDLESANIVCKRLIAERVYASEVVASESAAVSCYLTAALVTAGRLTVAANEVNEVQAEQVINLRPKMRTMFGALLASALRTFWLALVTPKTTAEVLDAEYTPVPEASTTEPTADESTASAAPEAVESADFELQRLIAQFKLARESGYTLKLVPGTPEENAPVFDLETERIFRPAA